MMSTRTLAILWLVVTVALSVYTFGITYIAGGWPMVRRDLPNLARETFWILFGISLAVALAVVLGPLLGAAVVIGAGVALNAGLRLWRRSHPARPLSERAVWRLEAIRSPRGRLLRNALFALLILGGLALGVVEGWTTG